MNRQMKSRRKNYVASNKTLAQKLRDKRQEQCCVFVLFIVAFLFIICAILNYQ